MLKRRTLFIVGAGASKELELPDGRALRTDIANRLNISIAWNDERESGDVGVIESLLRTRRAQGGGTNDRYLAAAKKLRAALPLADSVDNVLDAFRDDKDVEFCGKLGIASAILDAERNSRLALRKDHGSRPLDFNTLKLTDAWHSRLWTLLSQNVSRADVDTLLDNAAFIVFNYDRCIEHFLWHAVSAYYDLPPERVAQVMKKLRILHPYGTVGAFLSPAEQKDNAVGFGANVLPLFPAKSIRTFTERIEDKDALAWIDHEVLNAETIVILGFAYHPQNMQLLMRKSPPSDASQVFATALGFSQADVEQIYNDLVRRFQIRHPNNVRVDRSECWKLFDDYRFSLAR